MKNSDIAVVFFSVLCLFSTGSAKKGFLLTSPKSLSAGTVEYFTFTVFDVPSPRGTLHLTLLHWYTDEEIANATVDVVSNLNMWVEMAVPPSSADLRAKLRVEGSFGDGLRIDTEKEVHVRHSSVVTFVQTDKPVYKPEQTVRFRVLPLNSQLRPLAPDTVADVWIEDPSNIRVSQWKQVKFTEGIVQLELPLSDEPPLGEWSIKTVVNQVSHTHKFHVEKYVLPQFEVKVNPPSFIMADADFIPLEICAWYSYGKKVDGIFKAKITYKKYTWESKAKSIPSVEHSGLISGCETVHVNTQDILLQTSEFGGRTLEFVAEVVENSTAISGNASASSSITHTPLQLKFVSSDEEVDFFKPGIPFDGELSVHKPNDDPAPNERIEICAEYQTRSDELLDISSRGFGPSSRRTSSHCHTFTTNKRGRVRFSVPPKSTLVSKITLKASAVDHPPVLYREGLWAKKLEKPFSSLVLRPWYSPSGHQVQIEPHNRTMECGRMQKVRVRYTARNATALKFYHQVTSRGRIVQQGSHLRTFHPREEGDRSFDLGPADPTPFQVGEFLLSLDPRAPMAPRARLLVFYIGEDGEIVADSRKFSIEHCLPNKVKLHFRHEQQYPNTEASLLLSAAPHSVCGIGLVDKTVTFLSHKNQFSKNNIFKAMEKFDVGREAAPRQMTEDYCQQFKDVGGDGGPQRLRRHYLQLSRKVSFHADASRAFEEAGMVVISNFDLETRPCEVLQSVAFNYYNPGIPGSLPSREMFDWPVNLEDPINLRSRVAHSQPGRKSQKAKTPPPQPPKEEAEEIRSYFPETWLWEMHTVGLSGETALSRRLPHSVTRWVGGAVCVHPKRGLGVFEGAGVTSFQPFFLSLRLPYSVVRGEAAPLLVTIFNYLEECLAIKLTLEPSPDFETNSSSHTLCVCGGESRGHRFVVRPTTLGRVNVTVYGFSLQEDGACGTQVTARLAARDAVTRQLLVEAEGFPREEVFNYFVCPEATNGSYSAEVDLLLPEDVVESSGRAYVSVTGDLLGPSLHGGLKHLVRLPVGCGEQNMVLFTPNILVLDYLQATSRITPQLKEECVRNMQTGYQRELKYRHLDGSYSAFGARDAEGSLWLTAFVVRSFGQARRFVEVDEQDLGLSTTWILSKQFENGCFEPSGFMLNKAMKGGLESAPSSLSPLAAYVLISLLESGALRPEQPPVRSALACLKAEANPSAYALALFAYAAVLAKEPAVAEKYLRQLEVRAIVKGSQKYWSSSGGGLSVGVETAGYYVLARMTHQGREASGAVLPVVRWIVQQRNAQGGFISTQDTVVALQALSLYSSVQTNSILDMGLVVEGDDLVKGFRLEDDTRLVTQTAAIPQLPAVLDLQAVGEGCALVQFSLRYNVARVTASNVFDLSTDAKILGSSNCNLPAIGVCMRYRLPEQTSNMVVVSVKMASGFVPDDRSLFKLESDSKLQLMRHEVEGNQVNFYFNELTNEEKCFQFFMKQELEVDDIKPSSVKLYDYYQPEHEITKYYTIPLPCTNSSLTSLPTLTPPTFPSATWQTTSEPTSELGTTRHITNDSASFITTVDQSTMSDVETTETERNGPRTAEASQELMASEVDDIARASVSDEIIRTSEDGITEIEDATSTNSEILVDSENDEPEISAYASEEHGEELVTPVELTTKMSTVEANQVYLDTFSKPTLEKAADDIHTDQGENLVEMGDDAETFQINEEHHRNFVDLAEDLDFPDGIEGNMPVAVLPTNEDIENLLTGVTNVMGCPVCDEEFPENFTEIYCSSTLTLRILIRNAMRGSVRILQDLSSHLPGPKPTKIFAKLEYDRSCPCPQLFEKNSILLVLGGRELWDAGEISLTGGTLVLPFGDKATAQLTRARRDCP